MPEENKSINLQEILELLEDPMLNKPLLRGQYLKTFSAALDSGIELSHSMIDRLLSVCIQDLENDTNCIAHALKTLTGILKRIKTEDFPPSPNLLSSILAVLKIVKTSALMNKMENMQKICFEILDLYSDETLLEVTLHTSEITEVLNMYGHVQIPLDVRILPCQLVLRLLKILPKEKKSVFVKENLPIWFSKVIPTCVFYVSNLAINGMESSNCKALETLECLTDELVPINYSENAEWVGMLESIYSPSKYPATLRAMLNNNSNKWHRLWIVFVRLLKDQITKTTFSSASPINSMLPVVEVAFKMDVANRCRAFQCWNVLIDNFRMETNLAYIVKRMKLLIIPLKSNNAKVEETAIAKLNTWWHLILSYQTKLDKFVDKVLISFLQFCFGSPSPSFVPGLISENTKKLGVEAFVELGGHLCCSGCGGMPKLTKKIISKSILVDHWTNWVYSFKKAISILNEDIGVTIQQIQCLWKSFVVTVAELPDNNIRKDLFNELLAVLESLEKQSESNNKVADVVVQLACSLFDDERIEVLLKPENEDGPVYKIIILLILNPSLNIYYKRRETVDIVTKFKPLARYILKTREFISWLVRCPSLHNVSYLLTAIAEIVYESQYEEIAQSFDFIMWPLKPKNVFTDVEYSTKVWVTLMNYVYPKLIPNIQEKLITIMRCDASKSNMHLKLRLCMSILKYQLENDSVPGCKRHIELLTFLTSGREDYQYVRDNLALLTDTIVILTSKMKYVEQSDLLKYTLAIIKHVIQFIKPILDETEDFDTNKQLYENLLKNVEMFLHCVKSPMTSLVEELLNCKAVFIQHPSLQPTVLNIMKMYASNPQFSDSHILSRVKASIDSLELKTVDNDSQIPNESTFAAPDTKAIVKKVKKKETTIVNTVTENGEEFEVIKSNWKFNPRKLTENQKEKLQRKREDIPALYQDLSQSQDDFKLATWKTDSQDTSSTSSKSTTNSKTAGTGNVSEILKNIPSSDVVPKIIENIFSEKKNTDISSNEKTAKDTNEVKPSNLSLNSTSKLKRVNTKDPKSPRMALKDRVFRNVRNLIEKSNVQKDNKDLSESLIQVENVPKTPTSKIIDNNHLVNSAPPNLGAERPSRLKRKPKKFDDVQIFSLKKTRRSTSLNDSQSDSQESHLPIENPADEKLSIIKPNDGASEKHLHSEIEYKTDNPTISTVTTKAIKNAAPKSVNIENEMVKITTVNSEPLLDPVNLNKNLLGKESSQTLPSNSEVVKSTSVPIQNEVDELKKIKQPAIVTGSKDKDMDIECTPEDIMSTTSVSKAVEGLLVNDTSNIDVSAAKDIDVGKSDDKAQNVTTSKNIKTPKQTKLVQTVEPRSGKRNSARKSRIEKELAIDMVEGHPFLKIQTEKRITRKNLNSPVNSSRRKSLTDKLNKTKVDSKTPLKTQSTNLKKKEKDASSGETSDVSVLVDESQEKCSENSDELPFSEDVIESSQDSTFSTLSVKSSKPPLKKLVVVAQKIPSDPSEMLGLLSEESINKVIDIDNTEDADLPQNKTSANDNTDLNSTENMDTQPVDNKAIEDDQSSSDVIIINDDEEPIIVSSETQEIAEADTQPTNHNSETQEIANADTQPTDSSDSREQKSKQSKPIIKIAEDDEVQISNIMVDNTEDEVTKTIDESIDVSMKANDENTASSPFKDQEQRKKDFLDNTLEISPIKTMSPVRDKKSPSPETSSDYVLIKLTSPVQSNGEPFEKCDSPEIFTEEKVSPDKRDLSPPREENVVNNTSPSSSLSLKKNRPQVRSGGRAAQMLGLCVPDRLQTIMNSERSENEEPKKSSPSNTPARRNLRILYSSVGGDGNDNSEENDDSENFLRFKKTLPTSDCSPSGPILKRKLAEIADDATVSPASKRKRVSFHDPPVSTTIAVQKYIEPSGIRSPQNSALKRQERQNLRSQAILKSPKRLDNVFKLDTVLTKAVESFTESDPTSTDITQSMSLDETPALEIVRISELNDVDPICPDLTDCTDPIDKIAADLSSSTMKDMFLKELDGKITTVGDLARMTELEVNRLCIKAPKVKVARKVLTEYSTNKNLLKEAEMTHSVVEILGDEKPVGEDKSVDKMDVEVQTHLMVTNEVHVQTNLVSTTVGCVQTDEKNVVDVSAQTNESGAKSTEEVITSCLAERPDFVENICEHLEESSKLRIAKTLSENSISDIFMKNVTSANSKALISRILQKQTKANSSKKQNANELLFLQDYLCDKFDNRDLILFCSQLLAKVHNKPS